MKRYLLKTNIFPYEFADGESVILIGNEDDTEEIKEDNLDFVKNEVYLVSEDKLGPEMMRVSLDGKIYWANANQLTQNTYQHPPFEGELKQRIINIQKELEAVNIQSYTEWEDGFRRDQNPESEIAIWERIIG